MKTKLVTLLLIGALSFVTSCYPDESVESPVKTQPFSEEELDKYIQANFLDKYGVAVRYKYVDRFVDPTKRVAPPRLEVVEPMLDFLTEFWVEPFVNVTNGKTFFQAHVPAEVVFIGSLIYNGDGTVTLGTADAGARITLTEVNNIDVSDREWLFRQLGTIYHEFAHIVHQRYNLPSNWQEISPQGYSSLNSWYNVTEEEALEEGFVSPYGTSTFNEDFAEVVAFMLYDPDFYIKYIDEEDELSCPDSKCADRNAGRVKLKKKYNAILAHYQQYTGVDLLKVRALIQAKL